MFTIKKNEYLYLCFASISGLPPTVLRDVPFSGIYWSCYESIKGYFNVTTPTFQFSFLAGATAGMVCFLKLFKNTSFKI